jgi:hypothetical protein
MGRTKQVDKPAKDMDALERIAEAVEKLAGEVEILRGIIDRLQDDFSWALNNDAFRREEFPRERGSPLHITSMPLDPLAPDWHDRVNRYRAEDLTDEEDEHDESEESVQRDLFSG